MITTLWYKLEQKALKIKHLKRIVSLVIIALSILLGIHTCLAEVPQPVRNTQTLSYYATDIAEELFFLVESKNLEGYSSHPFLDSDGKYHEGYGTLSICYFWNNDEVSVNDCLLDRYVSEEEAKMLYVAFTTSAILHLFNKFPVLIDKSRYEVMALVDKFYIYGSALFEHRSFKMVINAYNNNKPIDKVKLKSLWLSKFKSNVKGNTKRANYQWCLFDGGKTFNEFSKKCV